jgi:ATP:cob(I)alamin adenosyltransferase
VPAIYTRAGDAGLTGLFGGTRVPKQEVLVEAYGSVDELNAAVGAAKVASDDPRSTAILDDMQRHLYLLAAELASDERGRARLAETIGEADIVDLEHLIDQCVALTGPLHEFTVPGYDEPSIRLHQARTIARRAERRILTAGETHPIRPLVVKYVNRLSDALFALARVGEVRVTIEALVRRIVQETLGPPAAGAPLQLPQRTPDNFVQPPPKGLVMSTDYTVPTYDLAALKIAAAASEAKGAELGVPIVFVAVDAGGNLILVHRQADSLLASIRIAQEKAYTAASLKQPTANLAVSAAPGGALYGINTSDGGKICVFGGGVPIFVGGQLAGGLGVSGGTVDEDIIIVNAAVAALQA